MASRGERMTAGKFVAELIGTALLVIVGVPG
jgi:glycerol uptake facilitator-like aquaporin